MIEIHISIYTRILIILLIVYQVKSSCPTGSKELDDQCSTYCYQVVKPLLQYVNTVKSMTQEHNELQKTIKVQAETIMSLNELIKLKDSQLAQQIKLSESFESHNRNQQKLVDQYEKQLTSLKSEINKKDAETKDFKSENMKLKEHKGEITAYEQTSNCKSTELESIRVVVAQTMTVPCDTDLDGPGWIVILRRKDKSVSFNRTWSEYKAGFGNLRGEFFLGLEKIHLLTHSQPHELYVFIKDFSNETRHARYNNFVIGNEQEVYELKELGAYSGNAGDPMGYLLNEKFSTPDMFNQTVILSGADFGCGWWFPSCYCKRNEDCGINLIMCSLSWNPCTMEYATIFQMMIRPVK